MMRALILVLALLLATPATAGVIKLAPKITPRAVTAPKPPVTTKPSEPRGAPVVILPWLGQSRDECKSPNRSDCRK